MLIFNCLHQIKLIKFPSPLKTTGETELENKTKSKERVFSIELRSKANVKNITLTNGSSENVLVEGTLGELVYAVFREGIVLEVIGKKGTFRINLEEKEITKTNRVEVKNQ